MPSASAPQWYHHFVVRCMHTACDLEIGSMQRSYRCAAQAAGKSPIETRCRSAASNVRSIGKRGGQTGEKWADGTWQAVGSACMVEAHARVALHALELDRAASTGGLRVPPTVQSTNLGCWEAAEAAKSLRPGLPDVASYLPARTMVRHAGRCWGHACWG